MTPIYDWTRFDALRERLRHAWEGATDGTRMHLPRLRGKLADAREALERGQQVRLVEPGIPGERPDSWAWVSTPDQFCDLWEQGYRP